MFETSPGSDTLCPCPVKPRPGTIWGILGDVGSGAFARPGLAVRLVDGLTVATSLVVLGLAAIVSVSNASAPHVRGATRLAWLLWGLAAAIVLLEWTRCGLVLVRDAASGPVT